MRTPDNRFLVFIHGVGGAMDTEEWLTPLSDVMVQVGHSRPQASGVEIVTVDYRDALKAGEERRPPKETWHKPDDLEARYNDYQVRRSETERIARMYRSAPPLMRLAPVPTLAAHQIAALVEKAVRPLREEAHRYRRDDDVRARVLDRVLSQLPTSGSGVVLAHSLGSVVAADLIKRLPGDVVVDQLITVGSPLPISRFWPFVDMRAAKFPYDRLRSWVNVFDSLDPVSVGRGIGSRYPEALDVNVHVGRPTALVGNHAAVTYLSLPVVGALVGDALTRDSRSRSPHLAPSGRECGSGWDLYLLGAAYAQQLSATCDPKKHRWRRRFDAARRISVEKMLAAAEESRDGLVGTPAYPFPAELDFLDQGARLVEGKWSDDELLPFAVALLMSSPVRPLSIPIDEDHAQEALAAVLDRVRRRRSNIADTVFAKRVATALDEARDEMGGSRLWALLMLGGAVVLAATGVGLWVAAPAGLAGAAMLTSTLAAFGPGGMVGGMLTITAASGAGSALVGAGVANVTNEKATSSFVRFVDSLANLPREELRSTATAMIAVLIAQERLGLTSSVAKTKGVLGTALVQIVNERNTHRALGSKGAREWEDKREIVERALEVIAKRFPDVIEGAVSEAIGSGKRTERIAAVDVRHMVALPSPPAAQAIETRRTTALPPGGDS